MVSPAQDGANADSVIGQTSVATRHRRRRERRGGVNLDSTSSSISNSIRWGNAAPSAAQIRTSNVIGTITHGDGADGFTGTRNLSATPSLGHAPVAWDRVVAAPALDVVTVSALAAFAVGDHIEIAAAAVVARQIAAIAGNDLTFTPALASQTTGVTVQNGATESANPVADYPLATGSPSIDTGTPAGADMGAYR